ncbi:hypothetical protein CF641_37465 [Burkholderia pseudomallei]|nr:hypothetical protein CF641_37465 [Burkholderia pseudomallei]
MSALSSQHAISGFPVVEGPRLAGIVTNRNLRCETRLDEPDKSMLTSRERLATVAEGPPLAEATALMHIHCLERVLVDNDVMELSGRMMVNDILMQLCHPQA